MTKMMKNKILFGLLAAFACWLGFPNPVIHLPLFALLFPATLATVALQSKTSRQAFSFGLLSGIVGYSTCLYWVAVPVHDYGYMPWIVALPFPILLGTYLALYSGIFCLLIYKFTPFLSFSSLPLNFSKLSSPLNLLKITLFCALTWSLLEYLRGWLFTGFPWLTLSSAFVPWTWAIQGLSAMGAYVLSGLYAGIAISIALTVQYLIAREKNSTLRPVFGATVFALSGLAFLTIWTIMAFAPKHESTQAIGVVLVQGNIEQGQKWNPEYKQTTFNHYRRLTETALDDIAKNKNRFDQISPPGTPAYDPSFKLVVWPETAMPFFYSREGNLSQGIKDMVRRHGVYLVFGSPELEVGEGIYNRAYFLNPQGKTIGFYDKEHLVPFGEYAPPWLRLPILEFLLAQVGDLEPGTQTAPLTDGDVRMGMLICYEVIFPELAQKRVADGANILLTISNDAWFGNTSAPEQHLQLAIMRAVEQNRWLVRDTNTGITTIVNHLGERTEQGNLFVAETLTGLAYTQNSTTLFHKLEPYLPYILFLALLLMFVQGYIVKRRNSN